ncbi:MAG TPA: transcriptional repressor [Candidatus Magasanikbacteria bacterium]|nr:transcriptional repressor [Candidatus Magasanikbacteria bacterium]
MKHNWLLETLLKNGHKATTPRRVITEYLIRQEGLFCALTMARKMNKVDQVSIYRTLEIMKDLELINPVVNIDGQQFYEKNGDDDHHHHIICTNCKKTKCVDCKHDEIPKIPGFSNVRHSFILTGLCTVCKNKA